MNNAKNQDERIARMTFGSVYPHYLAKVEKKGRTKEELHQVIEWLTGYDENTLQEIIEEKATLEKFFQKAALHPNARLITGVICGYRVEEIENALTQQVRSWTSLWMNWQKAARWRRFCELCSLTFTDHTPYITSGSAETNSCPYVYTLTEESEP